ncbi:MAG: tyrosine recombinase XerC [Clostridiaceae bacterium]|jgi:site-specific recombinase XerD|nr:tyrosine recombinase XerC [Clostridiaceae bacterium]
MSLDFNDMPEIVIEFLNYMLTIKNISKKTVSEYHYDLRTFLRYIKVTKYHADENEFREMPVNDITFDDIKSIDLTDLYSFMSYTSRELNNSAITRSRKVACLRSFYKYLHTKVKLIDYNPAAELDSPKIVKRLPKYLNLEESVNLLQSVNGKKNVARDYAILVLFMNCGLRLSELVGINVNSIRGDTLTVIGKGNKERTVYLNKACQDAIAAYMVERSKLKVIKDPKALFLSERKVRISPKTVQYLVKKYIQASGLDPDKYSPHKLRHTAATLMYKHGNVDIRALQAILGHESIATTEIYTHIDDEKLRDAVKSNPLSSISPKKKNDKNADS